MTPLASSIAHEVKNPLTTLKTFFQYFPQRRNDPAFLDTFERLAASEFQRMEVLVRNLLDFAKPSAPEFREVDIHKLLNDLLSLLTPEMKKHNIELQFSPGHELSAKSLLNADPNQLKQAFLNILMNAIEVMPDGGTLTVRSQELGVRSKKPEKKYSLRTPNSKLPTIQIEIEDTGSGIPQETLKHLFEPFFTTKESGTGLGLAITKDIIENHKGKIKVEPGGRPPAERPSAGRAGNPERSRRIESALGQGTRFIVELPVGRN